MLNTEINVFVFRQQNVHVCRLLMISLVHVHVLHVVSKEK